MPAGGVGEINSTRRADHDHERNVRRLALASRATRRGRQSVTRRCLLAIWHAEQGRRVSLGNPAHVFGLYEGLPASTAETALNGREACEFHEPCWPTKAPPGYFEAEQIGRCANVNAIETVSAPSALGAIAHFAPMFEPADQAPAFARADRTSHQKAPSLTAARDRARDRYRSSTRW